MDFYFNLENELKKLELSGSAKMLKLIEEFRKFEKSENEIGDIEIPVPGKGT